MNRWSVAWAALCGLCVFSSLAWANLDPGVTDPYTVRVVLQISDHPLLSPIFKGMVRRELQDSLISTLGEIARVEVVSHHPLLKEVRTQGLQKALDAYKEVSEVKTHFILIDFVNGQYQILARQHDGFSGLSSPVVRETQTGDPQFVSRMAARLVIQDFGVVGTIEPGSKGDEIRLVLRGGRLLPANEPLIKTDEVFAVSQISQRAGKLQAQRVDWTLLQVVEQPDKTGVCRCKLYSRYQDPLRITPPVLGYRCLKLGTTRARLRIRLVKKGTSVPLANQQFSVSAYGFGSRATAEVTDEDGYRQTRNEFQNLAFILVLSGTLSRAPTPVEIVDEERTVVCPVSVDAAEDAFGELELQRNQWILQIEESFLAVSQLFKELNRSNANHAPESALAKAETGLKNLQSDLTTYRAKETTLRKEAANLGPQKKFDLSEGEQRLKELVAKHTELENFIKNLHQVLKEAPIEKELGILKEQAHLHEDEAEYDKAIELYEKLLQEAQARLKEGKEQPKIRQYLADKKKEWAIKDEEHRKAREFVYKTWPKQETEEGLRTHIKGAVESFHTFQRVGDYLSPRYLLKTNVAHLVTMKNRLAALADDLTEDNKKSSEQIIKVSEEVKNLNDEVGKYLKSKPK